MTALFRENMTLNPGKSSSSRCQGAKHVSTIPTQ